MARWQLSRIVSKPLLAAFFIVMEFIIEEKVPYLIRGGRPISNAASKLSEVEFFEKMKEVIGAEKFSASETAIKEHLKKPDSFIEFGDFIFSRR